MKDTDNLKAWATEERKKGLVDIKFFPGSSTQGSLEESARSILEALTGEAIDISNDPL